MNDTSRLIVLMVLGSFAIERVAASVDFFLSSRPKKTRKLVRVSVSAIVAIGIVVLTGIRILGAMKFPSPAPWLDFALTWLILVGGADKLSHFVAAGGSLGAAPAERKDDVRPIQIFLDNKDVTADILRSER